MILNALQIFFVYCRFSNYSDYDIIYLSLIYHKYIVDKLKANGYYLSIESVDDFYIRNLCFRRIFCGCVVLEY